MTAASSCGSCTAAPSWPRLRNTYRVAINPDHPLHELASMALSVQVLIAGLCFTGPAFNTQLGILFWLMTAIVYAAQRTAYVQEALAAEAEAKRSGSPVRGRRRGAAPHAHAR